MSSTGLAEPAGAAANHEATGDANEAWVLFQVDEQKYALRIWEVERIVRAVEVRPLPQSPAHVRGIVNVHGRVLPVVDLRVRFGRPSRDIRLEDHFIIARTPTLSIVLPVDAALGSREMSGEAVNRIDEARADCVRRAITVGADVVYALDLERVMFPVEPLDAWNLSSVLDDLQTA